MALEKHGLGGSNNPSATNVDPNKVTPTPAAVNAAIETPINPNVPQDLHPMTVQNMGLSFEQGEPARTVAEETLRMMYISASEVDTASFLTKTAEGRTDQDLLALQAELDGRLDFVARHLDKAVSIIDGEIEKFSSRIETALKPKADALSAQEIADIRSQLRGLPAKERRNTVQNAIDRGDKAVAVAVLSGSPLASGLDPETMPLLRSTAESKFGGLDHSKLHQARQLKDKLIAAADVYTTLHLKARPNLKAKPAVAARVALKTAPGAALP